MKIRRLLSVACGLVCVGSLAVGCGSKSNTAASTAESNAAGTSSSAPASYKDTSSPQGQHYNDAMKQSGSTKSPYSR